MQRVKLTQTIFLLQIVRLTSSAKMSDPKALMKECLPKQGLTYHEDMPTVVLCKPKLLPLKSVSLEKMEKMQREAQETIKQQELEAQDQDNFGLY